MDGGQLVPVWQGAAAYHVESRAVVKLGRGQEQNRERKVTGESGRRQWGWECGGFG